MSSPYATKLIPNWRAVENVCFPLPLWHRKNCAFALTGSLNIQIMNFKPEILKEKCVTLKELQFKISLVSGLCCDHTFLKSRHLFLSTTSNAKGHAYFRACMCVPSIYCWLPMTASTSPWSFLGKITITITCFLRLRKSNWQKVTQLAFMHKAELEFTASQFLSLVP